MNEYNEKPAPFLEKRFDFGNEKHRCIVVCAGYEFGVWRYKELARHLIVDCLLDFSLRYSEIKDKSPQNYAEMFNRAVQFIYKTEKCKNRGEIGEILLHTVCRQFYDSLPVVAKFFFKDSPNDTVKGYDAVHVVNGSDGLEIWLGEVKFYKRANQAVLDVIKELQEHISSEFLRTEFMAISPKIDPNMPHYDEIKRLLHRNTSLDKVFEKLVIPIFISYESPAIESNKAVCPEMESEIFEEAQKIFSRFDSHFDHIEIRVFLLPMHKKDSLVLSFDNRLKNIQEGFK